MNHVVVETEEEVHDFECARGLHWRVDDDDGVLHLLEGPEPDGYQDGPSTPMQLASFPAGTWTKVSRPKES